MKDEFYLPDHFRVQKAKNYQYEEIADERNELFRQKLETFYQQVYELYEWLLSQGVAREQARIVLPLSLYTQFYWTVNARSLMNFLSLRLDAHAQKEIRQYALVIEKVFREKLPWTYESFCRHHLVQIERAEEAPEA
jgi:thymidylate synthase (FAD)